MRPRRAARGSLALPGAVVIVLTACAPSSPRTEAKTETEKETEASPAAEATPDPASVLSDPSRTPVQRDLYRICNAEELSGALDVDPNRRAMHSGIWLAEHIESQSGRELSARLSQLPSPERIAPLQEALAASDMRADEIAHCEILYAWGLR